MENMIEEIRELTRLNKTRIEREQEQAFIDSVRKAEIEVDNFRKSPLFDEAIEFAKKEIHDAAKQGRDGAMVDYGEEFSKFKDLTRIQLNVIGDYFRKYGFTCTEFVDGT